MENELIDGWYWRGAREGWHDSHPLQVKSGQVQFGGSMFPATEFKLTTRCPSPEELLAQSAELMRLHVENNALRASLTFQDEVIAASEERVRGLREAVRVQDSYLKRVHNIALTAGSGGSEDDMGDILTVLDEVRLRDIDISAPLAPAPTSGEKPPKLTAKDVENLREVLSEALDPLCPDSSDGQHHSAPIGSEEDYTVECKTCWYCGEKASTCGFGHRTATGGNARSGVAPKRQGPQMNLPDQLAELKKRFIDYAGRDHKHEYEGEHPTDGNHCIRCGLLEEDIARYRVEDAMIEALEAANVVLPVLGWQGQNPDGDVLVCEICNGRGTGDAEPESVAHDDKCPVVTLRAALDRLSAVLEGGKS